MTTGIRLCKYLADAGLCSRRGASRLIEAGQVSINGKLASHTDKVGPDDHIYLNGAPVSLCPQKVYFLYHKPQGVDCRLRPDDPSSLWHHLPKTVRIFPAGRLDKDSRGLLLLTNDGELCQRLMHPDYQHQKGYLVTLDKEVALADMQAIEAGFDYGEGITRPCEVLLINARLVRMYLTEGKKRQIRRLWRARGYRVTDLLRDSLQQLQLGKLEAGAYRQLTKVERHQLFCSINKTRVHGSVPTAPPA